MKTVVLIPAYNPEPAMVDTARELFGRGFSVLIVNDGSEERFDVLFERAKEYAEVIGYGQNGGKGHALKHGIRHIMLNMAAECGFIVTADADGQHAVEDIVKVSELLNKKGNIVIGSRDFAGDVPFRSRFGNSLSRFAYTIETGRYIRDNQSGLRGFSVKLCEWLLGIKGEKYDYEINVLMYAAKQNIPVYETTIQTIYIEDNRSSHFDPVKDTLRLHSKMLMAALPSIMAFFVMVVAFFVLDALLPFLDTVVNLSFAGGLGIIASIAFNGMHFFSSGIIKYSFPLNSLAIAFVRTGVYAVLMHIFINLFGFKSAFLTLILTVIIVMPCEYLLLKLIGRRHIID